MSLRAHRCQFMRHSLLSLPVPLSLYKPPVLGRDETVWKFSLVFGVRQRGETASTASVTIVRRACSPANEDSKARQWPYSVNGEYLETTAMLSTCWRYNAGFRS